MTLPSLRAASISAYSACRPWLSAFPLFPRVHLIANSRSAVTPSAEAALGVLHDVALVRERDGIFAFSDSAELDGGTQEVARFLRGDGFNANA